MPERADRSPTVRSRSIPARRAVLAAGAITSSERPGRGRTRDGGFGDARPFPNAVSSVTIALPRREVGSVEEVDERPFEPGDREVEAGPVARLDAAPFLVGPHELPGKRDRAETLPAELGGPRGRAGEDMELLERRVRLPVELQRSVVAEDGVVGKSNLTILFTTREKFWTFACSCPAVEPSLGIGVRSPGNRGTMRARRRVRAPGKRRPATAPRSRSGGPSRSFASPATP